MDKPLTIALVAFAGVIVGIIVRDVLMQLYLFRRRRVDELETTQRNELIQARDIVRLYADPLFQSCASLNFRLKEVLEQKGRATFLLPDTPPSDFVVYKRISTLYRLAAVLGWIRAYRRERSYLDPADAGGANEIEAVVNRLESALADGPHVEDQRLNELLRIWVPNCPAIDSITTRELAVEIDNILRSTLTRERHTHALQLSDAAKADLCSKTAAAISNGLTVDIPSELIGAEKGRALAFFGIKEAYIYRDWQQAIGDLVLTEVSGTVRKYQVVGYGEFETLFLKSVESSDTQTRWITRLNAVFVGLEPDKHDIFDARRDQLKRVQQACHELQSVLEQKIKQYSTASVKV